MLRLLLIALCLLSACTKARYEKRVSTGRIIKLSVEPEYTTKYRVFTIGTDQSYWELTAVKTKLVVAEKPQLIVEQKATCWEDDCQDYLEFTKATIELPACSAFRDTQKYTIKESSTGAMFGLVYSSTTESQIRDEAIIMPCLATPAE